MTSLILSTAINYLLPLLLLLSVFLLLHGHNLPGGGFVGGLVAATAFSLDALAHGVKRTRALLVVNPRLFIGLGLLAALASGCLAFLSELPFLTGLWGDLKIPIVGEVGTPVLFDTGVYFVVLGVALTIILNLAED